MKNAAKYIPVVLILLIFLIGGWYIYTKYTDFLVEKDNFSREMSEKLAKIESDLSKSQESKLEEKFIGFTELVSNLIKEQQIDSVDPFIETNIVESSIISIAPDNLIRNSSFEAADSGVPRQWTYMLDSTSGNTFQSNEGIRSGTSGLKFEGHLTTERTGIQQGISQPITKTVPGREYTFSLYVKSVNVAEGTTLRFGFWDEYNNKYAYMEEIPLLPTQDWYRVSTTQITSGLITDSTNWFPIVEIRNHKYGAVYLDDLLLTEGSKLIAYPSFSGGGPNDDNASLIGNGSIITTVTGTIFPALDGQGSLGTTSNSWLDLYLVNASINEHGDMHLQGDLTVADSLTVNGSTTLKGDIVLGENGEDSITFNGSAAFPGGITVGENEEFTINNLGNITKVNGVAYSYPSVQGSATTVLINDGSGNLTWGTFGAASVDPDSLDFAQFADAMTLDADNSINLYDGSANRTLRFYNSSTADELLYLNGTNGNVGIGTTAASFALDVNGDVRVASGSDFYVGSIGLNDTGTSRTTSGASRIGTFDEFSNSTSSTVQDVLDDLDAAITTFSAGAGDIEAVGSMTSGSPFSDTDADEQWLGLGAAAGRIYFDDDVTDSISFLDANVGIGTTTITAGMNLDVIGNIRAGTELFMGSIGLNDTGTSNLTSGASVIGLYDEFTNSNSSTVQDVLDDIDSTLTTIASGTSVSWTDAGNYLYPTTATDTIGNPSAGVGKIAGLFLGNTSPLAFGPSNNYKILYDGNNLIVGDTANTFLAIGDSGTTGNFNFNNNQFYIRGDGSVGIGTTSPSGKLHISGTGVVNSVLTTTTSGSVNAANLNLDRGDVANGYAGVIFKTANVEDWVINVPAGTSDLRFYDYAGTAGERMRLESSTGNLGIGTTNPAEKLDVSGNIIGTGSITGSSFSGSGASLTALNATQLTTGTVPSARVSGSYTGITGTGALNAGSITSGFGNIDIGTDIFTGNGSGLTNVDADTLDGLNSSSFLRNDIDNSVASSGVEVTFPSASNINTATSDQGSLEVIGNGGAGTDAFMQFHIPGDYAVYFGLDGGINDLVVGGWSMGATSYRIWHAGNDGSGSGLDADLLEGLSQTSASTASTVVARDASSDINARLFRSEYDTTNATIGYIMTQIDTATNNYIRPSTPAQLVAGLGLQAGGSRDIWVEKAGDTMTGNLSLPSAYASNWFRAEDATGFYFEDRGTGIRSPLDEGGTYGSISTYGGESGWEGYSIDGKFVFMSDLTDVGIYNDISNRWIMHHDTGNFTNFYEPDSTTLAMSINASGNVGIGGTPSPYKLRIHGGSSGGIHVNTSTTGIYSLTTGAAHAIYGDNTTLGGVGVRAASVSGNGLNASAGGSSAAGYIENTSSGAALAAVANSGYGAAITSNSNYGVYAYRNQNAAVAIFENTVGSCTITPTGGTVSCSSDERLKRDVSTYENSLDIVQALRGVNFKWNKDNENDPNRIGFIAQEVQAVIPELVTTDEKGFLSMGYGNLTPILVNAIQEQQDIIEDNYDELALVDTSFTSQLELLTTDLNSITGYENDILGIKTDVASLEEELFQHEQQIFSLQTQMNEVFDIINNDEVASEEADLSSLTERISFLEQMLFGGDSANASSEEDKVEPLEEDSQALEDLTISGKLNVYDLGVVGDINTGQIVVHGKEGEINTLTEPLKIQSHATNPVEIMAAKVIIDTQGNLEVKGNIKAKKYEVDDSEKETASIGEGSLKVGETEVIIETTSVTESSRIFLTPTIETDLQLAVVEKTRGKSFKVKVTKPLEKDISFNWWIVN